METVIRSGRLAIGGTVLATSALPAQAVIVREVEKHPPAARDPGPDIAALRREIEAQLRGELQAELTCLLEAQREDAHRQGFAAGQTEGRAAADKAAHEHETQRKAQWEALAKALTETHAAALQRLRDDIGTLAFAAVCRLVGEQAACKPVVQGVVEAVCREAHIDRIATVRLRPRDLAVLAPEDAAFVLPDGASLQLIADESLALGGCVVETEAGLFDGSLDTQLRRLYTLLQRQG